MVRSGATGIALGQKALRAWSSPTRAVPAGSAGGDGLFFTVQEIAP